MDKSMRNKINSCILNNKEKVFECFSSYNRNKINHNQEFINNGRTLASPIVIRASQEDMLQKNICRIIEILSKLPEIAFSGDYDKYYNELGFDQTEKEIVKEFNIFNTDTCIARPDTFFDGKNFNILEFNISSALGGIITNEVLGSEIYKRLFHDLNIIESQSYRLPSVVKDLSNFFKKQMYPKKEINIALIMFKQDQQEEILYLQTMKSLLEAEGLQVYICDPEELEYNEGLMLGNIKT
jgi:hypothetical protein